jgi:hypothetical protein
MHDEILDFIVYNAFNGNGDVTGDDEFGVSVAWIDLGDYLDSGIAMPGSELREMDLGELSRITMEYNGNHRYALAFIDANGFRDIDGYDSYPEMMEVFREFEKDFIDFSDSK